MSEMVKVPVNIAAINYYMSASGDDANDGLTVGAPIATFAKALDIAQKASRYGAQQLVFNMAAGTYLAPNQSIAINALEVQTIKFKGPDVGGSPNVPIAIVQSSNDGTRAAGSSAMRVSVGAAVTFEDIYVKSYDTAFPAAQTGRITLNNVHSKNCKIVASGGNGGYITALGGVWDGRDLSDVLISSSIGFRAVIVCPFNLTQADYTSGLKIRYFARGAIISEGSSGHMDYMRFEDCATGVELTRGAGCPNMIPIQMRRCPIPILTREAYPLLISDTLDFAYGTADACGPVTCVDGAYSGSIDDTNFDSRRLIQVHSSDGTSNLTGSTAEVALWSNPIKLMPGRVRSGDTLDFEMFGVCSGGLTGTQTIRFKFGGATVGETMALPIGTSRWQIYAKLRIKSDTQLSGSVLIISATSSTEVTTRVYTVSTTTCIDVDDPTQVTISKQASVSGDNIQLSHANCHTSVAGITV